MIPILIFLAGMLCSAFFSGSETGFYRASRVRLALDARSGDLVARGLIALANNSALFVATTLVGNNLANYFTSLALVLGVHAWLGREDFAWDLAVTVAVAPLIFVYGELLPKHLFFHAPNRLLRKAGPVFLACTVLFLPIASVLWVMSRLVQSLLGEAPEKVQLTLARTELRRVLDEGHALGLLRPGQRQLANGMFAMANLPLIRFATPITRMASVSLGSSIPEMLRVARRYRAAEVLILDHRWKEPVGYVKTLQAQLCSDVGYVEPHPLMVVGQRESPITVLNRLQNDNQTLARVVDDYGKTLGIVTDRALVNHLLNYR